METPRVLIIAGSDSGGGAGIQADIKTVTMLGGHAMTAITAITAQNTLGVQAVMPVPADMVIAQIDSVVSDLGVDAVKIGMIGSAETAHAVADRLEALRGVPIVFDPVMIATSGDALADGETIAAFERLMRVATLTTPNLPELDALNSLSLWEREGAAQRRKGEGRGDRDLAHDPHPSHAFGAGPFPLPKGEGVKALLIKGGHGDGDVITDRLLIDGEEVARWDAERIPTSSTHGTGCTLASAIATYLARGDPLKKAVVRARQFVRMALKDAPSLGGGHGPMGHQKVRLDLGPGARLNQVTIGMADYAASRDFYTLLGLKQIVGTDDAHYARFEAAGGATLSIESGARPTLFFECEDLDAEVARLQDAGVTFDQLPTDQSWLWREARLTDPAGNAVCLYQADENRRFPPWRLTDA
ncbi:MAG: bifunctional hydroxymethylpyrimidine kinase/phosphomethylpyrimidine kinase [Pseudomonadota bacterium]